MNLPNHRLLPIAILILAAILEAGGDAIVRKALHSQTNWARLALLGAGALVLLTYGYAVNAPPWDFGKLLGLYVVFFFVIAQLMSWLLFNQAPSIGVLIGGALIASGGLVVAIAD